MESAKIDPQITTGQEDVLKGMAAGGNSTEEQGNRQFSEASPTDTCQDSGLCPSLDASHKPRRSHGRAADSPYMTSTPKKKLLDLTGGSEYEILSSQMILEDPLLSSIDEPECLTDHQAESLTSDEESSELSSRLHATQIRARGDVSEKDPLVYKLMNDVSSSRVSRNQSLSDTLQQQCVMEASASASIKKNLFDVPVSPKLKNRVRERLYTLINSLEGFEDRVYLSEEMSGQAHNTESLSKVNVKSPIGIKMDVHNFSRLSGRNSLDVSCRQHKSFHDPCNLSALSSSIVGHYECAISSIVGSQMQTLQYHQDHLSREKLALALQKKEQEASARISIYHEKLKLMIEMVEELELKLSRHNAVAREDAEHYERRLREQEEKCRQELAALRAECQKKIEEAEAQTRSAQAAAAKNCEQRISEVLTATRLRAVMMEKEHESQISELNSTINKLRAEKRIVEASLEDSISEADRSGGLAAGIPSLQAGREATEGEASQRNHGEPSKTGSRLHEDLLSVDLLKKKFQEEVEFWRRETERLQKKLHEAEVVQRKLINDTFQDLHSKSMTELELLRMQSGDGSEGLGVTVVALQEKLSQALKENIALKQKLLDSQKKESDLSKKLSVKEDELGSLNARLRLSEAQALQEKKSLLVRLRGYEEQLEALEEQKKQTILGCQLDMEKETSAAVSASLAHHQEKTRLLLADLRRHYEEVIRRIQTHSRAQISEYKKAVRYLKQRIKVMEKG
ncbi:coiled-coil domain-containing protein 38-like [Eriocheir sinensis]|uniref:coiled-coil domain-containing protein 38-like n=1 Tax=Eriocheir sinensis TaxID=95602 RepID=UPI0021C91EC5|nr:coiled-coil domain-containing protein 38-like [Eriocheir sinensis]XP_050717911.1 coiled-coil domain-containing protein 38-like [Eriocheir sinensis]XP_050717912.1 coiled-coil domain-containing protein 38-like [Eriocheir sinensis]XP_050717914.1 coiled-coil domain-containing protein 38-like [Eriocheir sinensis]XP_050717915.1 coiled-coil domain-containing protein 38-like [Eriocheir sinensis]XP_050717916.1 coiled-coil domain-containing protein 38-like [Eriocheir sinensis]XP_050717917.1 coiled-c